MQRVCYESKPSPSHFDGPDQYHVDPINFVANAQSLITLLYDRHSTWSCSLLCLHGVVQSKCSGTGRLLRTSVRPTRLILAEHTSHVHSIG